MEQILETLFRILNEHYYMSWLKKPVFNLYAPGRGDKWYFVTLKRTGVFEIRTRPQNFLNGYEEIISGLLHALVHEFCFMKSIQDTSSLGTYHNRRFDEVARDHGLITEYRSSGGFTEIGLSKECKAFIKTTKVMDLCKELEILALKEIKAEEPKGDKKHQGPRRTVFVCPGCKMKAAAVKSAKLICGRCNLNLIPKGTAGY